MFTPFLKIKPVQPGIMKYSIVLIFLFRYYLNIINLIVVWSL
jgi:hypothetical protein